MPSDMRDPRQLFDLSGKIACITGASSGLGRRAAVALAAAGAQVVGVARREDALASLCVELGSHAAAVTADITDRAGMGDLADRKPGEVSGGQQSRAALARVLVQDRPVVCLDEPFSALGPGQREEMLTLVAKVLTGRTVLLVTHDPEEARSAAEMAIFVSDGRAEPPTPLAALLDTPPPALARYLRRSG